MADKPSKVVLDPLFTLRGEVRPQGCVSHLQQGPDQRPAPGIDPA